MSKSAVIKEGDIGRKISPLTKLKINKQNSGNCYWLSGDDHAIDEKSVTSNGLYLPADDNLFAYSRIDVDVQFGNMISSNNKVVYVDKNGDLHEDGLPTQIRAVMPNKSYTGGEEIDLTKAVVTAYTATGDLWTNDNYPDGIIPFEELTFTGDTDHIPAIQSRKVPDAMRPEYTKADTVDVYMNPIVNYDLLFCYVYDRQTQYSEKETYFIFNPTVILSGVITDNTFDGYPPSYSFDGIIAAYSSGVVAEYWLKSASKDIDEPAHYEESYRATSSYTYQNKTVYWCHLTYNKRGASNKVVKYKGVSPRVEPNSDYYNQYDQINYGPLAWVALYGDIEPWNYDIGVSWNRPVDSLELTTTLSLEVDAEDQENG